MDYAQHQNIILKLNETDEEGEFPLLKYIYNNNIEMVNLFIEYANNYNIILEINKRNYNNK